MHWLFVTRIYSDKTFSSLKIAEGTLINIHKIESIDKWDEDGIGCKINMETGETIDVTETFEEIKRWFYQLVTNGRRKGNENEIIR